MSDIADRYPFVDSARAEQRRVRTLVLGVEQALGLEGPAQVARVADRLSDLRKEIREHCCQEDQGGMLEEAECRVPALAGRVEPLLTAWPAILTRTEALAEMVSNGLHQDRIPASLVAMIRRVLADVLSLESAEEQIIGQAFGINLDSARRKFED